MHSICSLCVPRFCFSVDRIHCLTDKLMEIFCQDADSVVTLRGRVRIFFGGGGGRRGWGWVVGPSKLLLAPPLVTLNAGLVSQTLLIICLKGLQQFVNVCFCPYCYFLSAAGGGCHHHC